MIVDLRIYTVRPGRVAEYVALYKQYAWPLQEKYLGTCLGWYQGLEGQINTVVHLWGYKSQADREARRSAMAKDPAWQDFVRRMGESGYLLNTENRIIVPTDFCPDAEKVAVALRTIGG